MRPFFKWRAIATILIFIGLGFGFLLSLKEEKQVTPSVESTPAPKGGEKTVIGSSVEGRKIEAYTYGDGENRILLVGGIHGGYEWNSVLLAYEFVDYFENNPNEIPAGLTLTVIPSLNPDGVYKVVGKDGRFSVLDVLDDKSILASGRFNRNEVDLNRNFDCKWKPESTWQGKTVSAGASVFSEPEAEALKNFVLANKPKAAVFLHSQANAVYGSECKGGILPQTMEIMNLYSTAAGYRAVPTFDSYEITGDAEGWLASINIPAITVELSTHESIEWEKNLAGVKALLEYYRSLPEPIKNPL